MDSELTNQPKWHQSFTFKLLILGFMGLILLIPLSMVKDIIMERQLNSEKVVKEISGQWADQQLVSGPVLNIPVRIKPDKEKENPSITIWHILPETLSIKSSLSPQVRKRGIYRAVVYDSEINITGQVRIPEHSRFNGNDILWNEAYFTAGLTDNRGLKGKIILTAGESALEAEPGVRDKDLFASGISFPFALDDHMGKLDIALKLNLSGSAGMQFTPLGKTTTAEMVSDWTSPSFNGNFLPVRRTINEKGFTARWEVTHLNRNFPQSWTGSIYNLSESSFGTDLFQPVDHYQKSWRSARYGILFIALTFLVLIFIEVTRKEQIHVFHYLLVSLALILFFSLLNAISEQVGFSAAYLISSIATITLISAFTARMLKTRTSNYALSGMLALLYTFIYVLLNLDDFAYLAGNIGLFILLGIVMMFSGRLKIFKAEDK